MSITVWLEELREDVKFAFRQLRRAPGFTLARRTQLDSRTRNPKLDHSWTHSFLRLPGTGELIAIHRSSDW